MSTTTNESILDTLTDEERQRAEAFVRDQRTAQDRAARARQLTDEHIARANERAAEQPNPLDEARPRWHGVRG